MVAFWSSFGKNYVLWHTLDHFEKLQKIVRMSWRTDGMMCGNVLMGETVVLDHLQFSKYSTAAPVVSGIGLSNASCCSRGKG